MRSSACATAARISITASTTTATGAPRTAGGSPSASTRSGTSTPHRWPARRPRRPPPAPDRREASGLTRAGVGDSPAGSPKREGRFRTLRWPNGEGHRHGGTLARARRYARRVGMAAYRGRAAIAGRRDRMAQFRAADVRRVARRGHRGGLLDIHLHQLAAPAPLSARLGGEILRPWAGDDRRSHTGVLVRTQAR